MNARGTTLNLPTGTITFLFTDIQGSTRLWEQHPEQMMLAHARHAELIVSCVEQYGGTFVRTRGEGDSTFSVFPTAADAITAACAFQRALAAEPWPAETPIRVRAALHTGTANLSDEDYNSSDVNRCARIRAIAHGGQTLLSRATYELAHNRLPEGVSLLEMGRHRLKDLQRPEEVYQLQHPELPANFPPLLSLENLPNNLPLQLTSFIGREEEIKEIKQLLSGTRLLTLTGPGGCGKTRLALQVAADLLDEYPDGVWLVDLAPLTDPALASQAVASVLGVREETGRPLLQTLIDDLKPKKLLLVLDNCEHLRSACAQLAHDLLRICPNLSILASSTVVLGISSSGETTYRVPTLSLPDSRHLPSTKILSQFEAVRLFIDRASAALPTFVLNDRNAPAVAQVCSRVEGIPLAIELAAARVRAISVEQIATRLDDRFRPAHRDESPVPARQPMRRAALDFFRQDDPTVPARHKTLRATIDWSYDLLSNQERQLLRRLAVFTGGWTLEAAEAVCAGEEIEDWEVIDLLTSLVEKSLVVYAEQAGRYRLLEPIRQYSRERLLESAEGEPLSSRHLDYFLNLAWEADRELSGANQADWLERLETEHDNFRAALQWCLDAGKREKGKGEREEEQIGSSSNLKSQVSSLSLAGALWRFWEERGYWGEGRAHLEAALAQPGAAEPTLARAIALNAAGNLAKDQGDYPAALAHYQQCVTIAEMLDNRSGMAGVLANIGNIHFELGEYEAARTVLEQSLAIRQDLADPWGIANSMSSLGSVAQGQGDFTQARKLYEQSLTLFRQTGDSAMVALVQGNLGLVATETGEYDRAQSLYEQSLALSRELDDKQNVTATLQNLGEVACQKGDYILAQRYFEESIATAREIGDKPRIGQVLANMGDVAGLMGDFDAARTHLHAGLKLLLEIGDKRGLARGLELAGYVAVAQKQWRLAVELFATAQSLRELLGAPLPPDERKRYDLNMAMALAGLPEEEFQAARAAGSAISLDQAVVRIAPHNMAVQDPI